MNESDSRLASPVVRRSPALRFRRAFPPPPPNNAGRGGQDVPLRSRSLQRSPATCPPSRCETAHQPSDHSTTILSLVPSRSHCRSPEAGNRKPDDSRRRQTTAHEHVQPAAHRGRTLRCPARLATTYAPMVPAHAPCVVRLEMTTGRVKPAAMGTALLNILSTSPMLRATDRAHPRGARLPPGFVCGAFRAPRLHPGRAERQDKYVEGPHNRRDRGGAGMPGMGFAPALVRGVDRKRYREDRHRGRLRRMTAP